MRAHTADVIVEAWASGRVACFREAVLGLVEAFADVEAVSGWSARSRDRVPVSVEATDDAELLVALLEDVIYVVDALDAVPVDAVLVEDADGGLSGWFDTVPSAVLSEVGATPKGVSRSDLSFRDDGTGAWRCRVEIDV